MEYIYNYVYIYKLKSQTHKNRAKKWFQGPGGWKK